MTPVLAALALIFAELSLLGFGGGNTILPEMQRQVVEIHGWMTAEQFSALFALAQSAPGPNMMIAPLIGWQVAGLAGLTVTTIATFAPSSILIGVVMGLWRRFKDKPWRRVVQDGLVPITVGLVSASAAVLVTTSDTSWGLALITVAAAGLGMVKRVHPLLVLLGGAVGGFALF
jgi:chromate transporter